MELALKSEMFFLRSHFYLLLRTFWPLDTQHHRVGRFLIDGDCPDTLVPLSNLNRSYKYQNHRYPTYHLGERLRGNKKEQRLSWCKCWVREGSAICNSEGKGGANYQSQVCTRAHRTAGSSRNCLSSAGNHQRPNIKHLGELVCLRFGANGRL